MSYEIRLLHPQNASTLVSSELDVGEMELTIPHLHQEKLMKAFGAQGIRRIYGKTGTKTIPILKKAKSRIRGCEACKLVGILLSFAEEHPEGVWGGN